MSKYHTPVMASESIRLLGLKPGGVYVDATLGAGGHAAAMLQACPQIRLMAFDRDSEALAEARQNLMLVCDDIWCPDAPDWNPTLRVGDHQTNDIGQPGAPDWNPTLRVEDHQTNDIGRPGAPDRNPTLRVEDHQTNDIGRPDAPDWNPTLRVGDHQTNENCRPGAPDWNPTLRVGDHQTNDIGRPDAPDWNPTLRVGAARSQSRQIELIQAPFSSLRTRLALRQIASIDGALFDLGVSSHQLDEASRGFSFDKDAPLDMRMDASQELSAADLLNNSDPRELSRVFKEYGEELQAARIARAIVQARIIQPIKRTSQLARVIESVAGTGSRESLKTKMRIFQAIRIAVNSELLELEIALNDVIMMLKPGGRVVVLSYHSLEDRIVKHAFRDAARGCLCPPRQIVCNCGLKPRLRILTGRPISASAEEMAANPRARSAKLRAAEKLDNQDDKQMLDSRLRGNDRKEKGNDRKKAGMTR